MTRKQLPFFLAFLVLMFGAMACACLGSGTGISGFTATANAAYTQAAGAAGTAGAQGNSASATANAAASQAVATANAAGGGTTSGGATDTPAAAQPTSAGSGGNGTTASGGPSDVPVMQGGTILVTTAQLVSYQTKSDLPTVVSFYKDVMPKNGWTADASASVETPTATVLQFKKDTRTAVITIGKDPSSGQTLVAVAIQ